MEHRKNERSSLVTTAFPREFLPDMARRKTMASTKSQRKATRMHRRRAAARGLVRVEVQAPQQDASLIRAVAHTLRGRAQEAEALRSALAKALNHPELPTGAADPLRTKRVLSWAAVGTEVGISLVQI